MIEDCVVGEDPYWLSQYPFLIYDKSRKGFILKENTLLKANKCFDTDKKLIIISHNAHYGHFIADDLPRLSSAILQLYGAKLQTPSTAKPKFTTDELIVQDLGIETIPSESEKCTLTVTKGMILHPYITDWAVRSYIAHKLVHSTRERNCEKRLNKHQNQARPRQVFIKRSKKHGSRISNLNEIQNFLETEGFKTVSLDELSLSECRELLANCSIAVAESGSTTLATAICLKKEAKLISLQPEALFANTSDDMIKGGAPYAMLFHPNITTVLAIEVKKNIIQSSSICHFEIAKIKRAIYVKQED